ncbi:DUF6153 family protein [Amycolatopsis panacis]|uniref:Uncharacterized protein n=1 Tax=Amycolatopsis panacis TaxID=2340917 RepID=A0A419I9U1_9PSEU|nr:DUF6153 family protein [Amycolatopsis panacis]RJQ89660.1 hypothetical protein D5S19_04225 [Amycolatopsis panacis]
MGTPARQSPLIRRLAFVVLVLGVLAMHHLPAPHGATGGAGHADVTMAGHLMSSGHESSDHEMSHEVAADPAGVHSMLHLCLAVLLGAAGLLLALFLLGRGGEAAAQPSGTGRGRSGARASPWRAGRGVLAAHCVLRI